MGKFSKADRIRNDGKIWECIIADEELAVFGQITRFLPYGKEKVINYKNIFVISQTNRNGFKYENFVGICEDTGKNIFENDKYEYDKEQHIYWLIK